MAHTYKHICGYPIEEGSDLIHCPGCGGRLTPWNLTLATISEDAPNRDVCLAQLAVWIVDTMPDLAKSLAESVGQEIQGEPSTEKNTCFSMFYNELIGELKK